MNVLDGDWETTWKRLNPGREPVILRLRWPTGGRAAGFAPFRLDLGKRGYPVAVHARRGMLAAIAP